MMLDGYELVLSIASALLVHSPQTFTSGATVHSVHSTPNGAERCTVQNRRRKNASSLLSHIFSGYESSIIPTRNSNEPITVHVELTVQSINSMSEGNGMFSIDAWYSQYWVDRRVAYTHLDPCRLNVSLDWKFIAPVQRGQAEENSTLWTPNVCFVNSYESVVHSSPSPNVLGMIFPNGTVWINYRVQVSGPCDMDLHRFPMDTQVCRLRFESYTTIQMRYNLTIWVTNYRTFLRNPQFFAAPRRVTLRWWPNPVTFIKQMSEFKIPEFTLVNFSSFENSSVDYPPGKWDQLVVEFTFQRTSGFYVLQAFIPTALCLVIGWLGFFLPTESVKARVSLGVMMLTQLTLTIGTIMSLGLPKVSYLRAVDVWTVSCLVFSFSTLCELCLASVIDIYLTDRVKKWRMNRGDARLLARQQGPYRIVKKRLIELAPMHPQQIGEIIDFWALRTFPMIFVIFVVTYWWYYVIYTKPETR